MLTNTTYNLTLHKMQASPHEFYHLKDNIYLTSMHAQIDPEDFVETTLVYNLPGIDKIFKSRRSQVTVIKVVHFEKMKHILSYLVKEDPEFNRETAHYMTKQISLLYNFREVPPMPTVKVF